jgi:hypothetical protein
MLSCFSLIYIKRTIFILILIIIIEILELEYAFKSQVYYLPLCNSEKIV